LAGVRREDRIVLLNQIVVRELEEFPIRLHLARLAPFHRANFNRPGAIPSSGLGDVREMVLIPKSRKPRLSRAFSKAPTGIEPV
jgi:hypothetical protein